MVQLAVRLSLFCNNTKAATVFSLYLNHQMSNPLYWERPEKRKSRNSICELGESILDESILAVDKEIEERKSYDSDKV